MSIEELVDLPIPVDFDLGDLDIDLDIDDSIFDQLPENAEIVIPTETNSTKRKQSQDDLNETCMKRRDFNEETFSKEIRRESVQTCAVFNRRDGFAPAHESPVLMKFLFSSIPKHPRMNTVNTFSNDLISCLNSSNFPGMAAVLNMHLNPDCEISISYTRQKLSMRNFIIYSELLNLVHPDRTLFGQTCEIQDNKIIIKAIIKFTDCKALYEAMAVTVRDPALSIFFPPCRYEILKRRMMVAYRPEPIKQQLETMLNTDNDLVIYGNVRIILTTDPMTHKGTSLHIDCDYNSVQTNENKKIHSKIQQPQQQYTGIQNK